MKKEEEFDVILDAEKPDSHYFSDLWKFREILYILSWRDIKVRYKQTILGITWSILRPLITIVIFVIVFDKIAHLPSGGVPYPLLVFVGILPWQFFSSSFTKSSQSLVFNSRMISKVYLPRLLIPTSAVVVNIVDLLISLILVFILFIIYQQPVDWRILTLPVFIFQTFLLAIGLGFLFSAMNAKYRDVGLVIPFIIQIGIYISPVGFTSSLIPEKWMPLYSVNPMVGIIDGFRWAFSLSRDPFPILSFRISLIIIVCMVIVGIVYFRKSERKLADII